MFDSQDLTILHVENDRLLAELVKTAFSHFGFQGIMIVAESVSGAIDLLHERQKKKEPLSLIISDMKLPDGTGLDVIREVKTSPAWRMTPVIVLSNIVGEGVINDAYALGANSYMPKIIDSKSSLESLHSFYQYWMEDSRLPQVSPETGCRKSWKRQSDSGPELLNSISDWPRRPRGSPGNRSSGLIAR
jgi:CheY-like chemotaxis protein